MNRRGRIVGLLAVAVGLLSGVAPGHAVAATAAASAYTIHSFATPTNFATSENAACLETITSETPLCDAYTVTVTNAGSGPTDGSPIIVTDAIPAGLTVQRISFFDAGFEEGTGLETNLGGPFCNKEVSPLQCEFPSGLVGPLKPDESMKMIVYVTVNEPEVAGPLTPNTVSVSGGGAASVSGSAQNQISSATPSFGVVGFSSIATGADGAPDAKAGDHPYELTTRIDLATTIREGPTQPVEHGRLATSVQDLRDVVVDLPLGFVGSALSTPTCTLAELSSSSGCPSATRVGHILSEPTGAASVDSAIFNLVPEHGDAAEFGYVDRLSTSHVLHARVVDSSQGYVLQVTASEVPEVNLASVTTTFFGNPAAKDGSGDAAAALFTNPSSCSGEPLTTTAYVDSWNDPGGFTAEGTPDLGNPAWKEVTTESPAVTECNLLQFNPTVSVQPETTAADSPTGLNFELKMPSNEEPAGLATPPIRNATVTLPAGVSINPGAADGLQACSPAQIALGSVSEPACPEASKIGTVEATTPLLPGSLPGSIFVATQNENPFDTLLAGYIVINDPLTDIVIKLPGKISLDSQTGQITGSFDDNPQFPVNDLKLHFFGGARGVLATPEACGSFQTTGDLSPWSAPDSGPDAMFSDSFAITSGCVSGFSPQFMAGAANSQAGAYSPVTLSFSRSDTDQQLQAINATFPPGLLAKLAGVTQCSNADASAGTCPASSQIGTVMTGVGPGSHQLFLPGQLYLTGPYEGAPFGEVAVVPAIAGPFNLGDVVVRGAIRVSPTTAQVSVSSDPFPTIVDGIPTRLRKVEVVLNRPGFTFNPTSCNPMTMAATISSTGGLQVPVASRFQVGNCNQLPFKPVLSASTKAKTSKAGGASLEVKVATKPGEANIGKIDVSLPVSLPTRLTTLQKACTEAQFAANPGGCPTKSVVGTATAITPDLASPLVGPAYLVSHGGAAFPDVVVVLQGEGITVELTGNTDIKKGITYSRFEAIPDAPVSSFALTFPQGTDSLLAATVPAKDKGSLCSIKLLMPTTITAQSEAQIKQVTTISVAGCPKAKTTKAKKMKKPKSGKKKKAIKKKK
jgi:uncharacterized repeat protein (TIGR01451 family)